ncbi:hypothetical protein HOY80DRAFT_1032764 [Tuber brumale]|nr:hypothetical protein HOY80DRAFT_1032764 [Tuber brumale]
MPPLFHSFLQDKYSKYKAVFETIYKGKEVKFDKAFGRWTSCLLVINSNTNNYKDVGDVCYRLYTVVALVYFKGGNACFAELGVKTDCPPSALLSSYERIQ